MDQKRAEIDLAQKALTLSDKLEQYSERKREFETTRQEQLTAQTQTDSANQRLEKSKTDIKAAEEKKIQIHQLREQLERLVGIESEVREFLEAKETSLISKKTS